MKSYTDLEQSKKLTEMLPLESADMCFNTHNNMPPLMTPYRRFKEFFDMESTPAFLIPCWSLAALLDVLPKSARLERGKATELYRASLPVELEASDWYINPVDACYEMIIKLNEQKIL